MTIHTTPRALLIACLLGSVAAAEPLAVVATTTDLAAIAREVGGDGVRVTSLCAADQDPHYLEAKPSFMVQLRDADLFVKVGMQMEIGYEKPLLDGARNGRIQPGALGHFDASTLARRLEVPTGVIDRSQGDVHPDGNPHYGLDPGNACRVARGLAERLGRLAPAGAAGFTTRAEDFARRVAVATFGQAAVDAAGDAALWAVGDSGGPAAVEHLLAERGVAAGGWLARLAPGRGKRVYTFHRTHVYLFERFGIVQGGELEPKPGIPPSPRHLAGLIEGARREAVALVLIESYRSDAAAKLVGAKIGAPVLSLPVSAGGTAGTESYIGFMEHVVTELARVLAAPAEK